MKDIVTFTENFSHLKTNHISDLFFEINPYKYAILTPDNFIIEVQGIIFEGHLAWQQGIMRGFNFTATATTEAGAKLIRDALIKKQTMTEYIVTFTNHAPYRVRTNSRSSAINYAVKMTRGYLPYSIQRNNVVSCRIDK